MRKNNKYNMRTNKSTRGAKKGGNTKGAKNAQSTERGPLYEGTIDASLKGFGFFVCPQFSEDIFIASDKMNGALHGDRVRVRLCGRTQSGKKSEGRVVEVLERANTRIVGTFKKSMSGTGYVEPDNARIAKSILVKSGAQKNARDNDKVVVELDFDVKASGLHGNICEVLGAPDDKNVDMMSIIRTYNLYEDFPDGVQKEADNISNCVLDKDKAGRTDFTNELVITIDGEDSKDFDDAVCVVPLNDGVFRLSVHIADVAHYVKAGSKLDEEALKRGTSVYFPDLVLPMLPKKLSNGICSLNEGVDRLTLSIVMDIDKNGIVLKHDINEGIIRSAHRMTYTKVAGIIEGDKDLIEEYHDVVQMIEHMRILAQVLLNKRKKRGAIDFDIPESQILLDDNTGAVVDIIKRPRLFSHRIIEEFMLVANETIAYHMCREQCPFVYRAHEAPPVEKIEVLESFLDCLSVPFEYKGESPTPLEFQAMLLAVPQSYSSTINRVALRAMSKASYEPQNLGHYGLAAQYYCHFTSPIRRYPDLIIHRIIKDFLNNGKKALNKYVEFTPIAAKLSSERERLAEKAEREVDDMKKANYMRDKIGNTYKGIVSGVTEFGLFVELENSIEGLIKTESLTGYYYAFNPSTLSLSNGTTTFKMGQELSVIVESVNMSRILFTLAND